MSVVVIGGVNVDVLAASAGALAPGLSTPGRVRIAPGGAGRNVAENLARLGVAVRLLAAADAHPLTDVALGQASGAGVDVSEVVHVRGMGNYYVAVEDAGTVKYAVSDMSAAEALTPGDLDARASLIGDAEAVVVDANLHPATIVRAVELTKPSRLCLLPVSRAKATRLRGVLKCASLLITGAPEAEVLTGLPIHGAADALKMVQRVPAAPGTKIVITLGGQGMAWRWDGEASWLDALPAAVVDPTGAGDAVAAVAVYALVRGVPSARAARLALAAAAMTVSVEGATHPGLSLDALHARV